MIIIGIDPGYDRMGTAVLDSATGNILHSACFQTSPKDEIYARFRNIGQEIERLIGEFHPDELALENLYISKNQKTAMRVSEARGIIIYEAARNDIPVYEYNPMQIKLAVTGDGTSDKQRVMKMIGLLTKLPKKKMIDDEYDAIAVALTHAACRKSDHVRK